MRDERQYVIEAIRAFLDGSHGACDWDNFTSLSLRSVRLDDIRGQAGAVALPLDAEGEATLRALLDEAEQLTADGRTKPKWWRMEIGMMLGGLVGAPLWWISYLPGGGLFQNLHLILCPAAIGIGIVASRNKREQVGYHDPEIIAQNKRGRV